MRWLAIAVVVAVAAAYATWPRINVVETGQTPEYPDVQPRTYAAGPVQVRAAVEAAIQSLPRWELTGRGTGPAATALHAVRTTRVFRFKDDVTIRLSPLGAGTLVNVRSASRVGQSDFGQNARNIRELLAAVDARVR